MVNWKDGPLEASGTDPLETWEAFLNGQHELELHGDCPRCGEKVSATVPPFGVVITADASTGSSGHSPADGMADAVATAAHFAAPVLVRCNCSGAHRGRPKERHDGCGAFWVARPVFDEDELVYRVGLVTDPAAVDVASTIHAATLEADAGLHALAEKWIPGLAVITGTFGLAAVVVNKDAVKTLSEVWTIVAYVLVVAATLMAVAATSYVYRAAYGWPQEVDFRSAASTAAAAESFSSRTLTRGRRLRTAVGLSAGAVVALLVALGVLWIAPAPAAPLLQVTYLEDGEDATPAQRCGKVGDVENGALAITVDEGPSEDTTLITLSQITSVKTVHSCE